MVWEVYEEMGKELVFKLISISLGFIMKQSILDRIVIFTKRVVSSYLSLLKKSKRQGFNNGPKIFLNSIPKAGTHLLDSMLHEFPTLRPSVSRTVQYWAKIDQLQIDKILSIHRGTFLRGHVPAHLDLIQALNKSDIKTLLIVRDPRAIVVSHEKYISQIDTTHPAHKYLSSLDAEARILACINGVEGMIESIENTFKLFQGWLELENCLVVRFEDLVGARGGSSDEVRLHQIQRISDFLGINLSAQQLDSMISSLDTPKSSTFRSGQIDGWKKHLNEEQLSLIKKRMGQNNNLFGYHL